MVRNQSLTPAAAGDRVLLIDADLRRPTVAKSLMIEGAVGLTSVLIGEARLEEVVQPIGDTNLEVLASGPIPPNPAELLGYGPMRELLAEATQRYDVVIIDSPPVLPVTDAAVLSQITNGTLVVAAAGAVRRPELAGALANLEQVDARVLGVLLNRVRAKSADQYGYRYNYQSEPQARRPRPTSVEASIVELESNDGAQSPAGGMR